MTNRDREILVDNINVLFHIFSQISNRVTQNNYIKGELTALRYLLDLPYLFSSGNCFATFVKAMPLAEQHLVQHEDTILDVAQNFTLGRIFKVL